MSARLIALEQPPEKTDPAVIAMLEEVLALAKDGQISFACVGYTVRGNDTPIGQWQGVCTVPDDNLEGEAWYETFELRDNEFEIMEQHHPSVEDLSKLVKALRVTADKLEREDYGGLTGVVIVLDAVPGSFEHDGPLVGAWVSMQGGKGLYKGLLEAVINVATLRKSKEGRVQ
jgi:hypothetical protein